MGMRIIRLEAENVKRLIAVDIVPKSDMVVINGQNGAGKSSVLDAILYALGGKSAIESEPIRKGTDKAEICIDLGEYTVTRRINKKSSTLEIKKKDGSTVSSPQSFLDKIVGNIAFDPLAFINCPDAKVQRNTLLTLAGVDTTSLDSREKELREKRTAIGRVRDKAEALVKTLPSHPEVEGQQEQAISDLMAEFTKASKVKNEVDDLNRQNESKKEKAAEHQARIEQYKKEISEMEAAIVTLVESINSLKAAYRAEKERIMGIEVPDTASMALRISTSEETNAKIRAHARYTEAYNEFTRNKLEYDDLSREIEGIMEDRKTALANAPLPVPGLCVDEEGIRYNGVPLDQCSDGEKLMIGVGISMALNPTLRVIRIKDGSLLDQRNRELLKKVIKDADFQLWIETVGGDASQGILIEEGEVVKIDGEEVPKKPRRKNHMEEGVKLNTGKVDIEVSKGDPPKAPEPVIEDFAPAFPPPEQPKVLQGVDDSEGW